MIQKFTLGNVYHVALNLDANLMQGDKKGYVEGRVFLQIEGYCYDLVSLLDLTDLPSFELMTFCEVYSDYDYDLKGNVLFTWYTYKLFPCFSEACKYKKKKGGKNNI